MCIMIGFELSAWPVSIETCLTARDQLKPFRGGRVNVCSRWNRSFPSIQQPDDSALILDIPEPIPNCRLIALAHDISR
jgi:hypothetical protein